MNRPALLACLPIFFLLAIVSFSGCGESGPPTGDLSGIVFSGDSVMGDCVVGLYDPKTKRSIGGKVDLQGGFKISKIPLGDYQVTVLQRTTNSAKEEPFDKRIPAKYRDSSTSGFEITIEEGENSIDLKMVAP